MLSAEEIYEEVKHIPEDTSFDMPNIRTVVMLSGYLHGQPSILEIGSWLGRSAAVWALASRGAVVSIDINPEISKIAQQFIDDMGLAVTFRQRPGAIFDCDFDVAWIDGNHDYEEVKKDLEATNPHTKILICGHDYAPAFPGVIKAVDEFFGKENVKVDGNIWYIIKQN